MTFPVLSANGPSGYNLTRSLRFRSSASAYLNRTFTTPTSATIWTWSAWVKRGAITGTYRLFGASTTTYLTFNSSDQLNLTLNGTSAATSTAVFRDPSSWYHIVYQQNGSAQTIYVNNVSVATGTTAASIFNTAIAHQIGAANTSNYFDGYLAEVNFIDGQALTPSSFGSTNATTGVWQPARYTGTYGTNGFYLPFTNTTSTTTLGYDSSGNSNNWTTNNISLTAGVTYDSMTDVPTLTSSTAANFAVWNPNYKDTTANTTSTSNGNLTTNGQFAFSSIGVTTGKFYFELTIGSANNQFVGVCASPYSATNLRVYNKDGTYYTGSGWVSYGATYTTSDVIGVALDMTNQTIEFFKNNTSQGQKTSIGLSGQTIFPMIYVESSGGITVNFGQRPFSYTPPSGFVALNTYNLPASTIITSGTFTGNVSAGGPFVYLNGVPTAMTINGNSVTFGTDADKLSNGFKVRSASASYNASGSNTYSISTTGAVFKNANAQGNP